MSLLLQQLIKKSTPIGLLDTGHSSELPFKNLNSIEKKIKIRISN